MPIREHLTGWQHHRGNWIACRRCGLCETRRNVVLARGSVPCDVLFIGEAPGFNEDTVGKPFVGPAGREVLDVAIRDAWELAGVKEVASDENGDEVLVPFTYALTNIIACIPKDDEENKTSEPPGFAVEACRPRLIEFIRLCKPRGIVLLGKHAREAIAGEGDFLLGEETSAPWMPEDDWIEFAMLPHPAWIVRMPTANRGLETQRLAVGIAEVLDRLARRENRGPDYRPIPEDDIPF